MGKPDLGAGAVSALINPYLFYIGLAIIALGVAIAMPRRRVNPQLIGGLVAGGGVGLLLLGMLVQAPEALPNVHFYIFGIVALAGALRMITHPRPVYAALYFILTILASCGLYVILAAEFMAFALVIIYAGAILITYLFVIMLATQAPSEDRIEVLAEYDVQSRGPVFATIASFVLLAGLTSLVIPGAGDMEAPPASKVGDAQMSVVNALPLKTERELQRADLIADDETLVSVTRGDETLIASATVESVDGTQREVELSAEVIEALTPSNIEMLGFDLLRDNPGTIEIAGVILLMAMLGATVLARKQVDMEEEAKRRAAEKLAAKGGLVSSEGQA